MKRLNIEISEEELGVILSALAMFQDEEESEQKDFVGKLINKLSNE